MELGIALIIAYTPFLWWVYKQAKEDLKESKIMKRTENEKNRN